MTQSILLLLSVSLYSASTPDQQREENTRREQALEDKSLEEARQEQKRIDQQLEDRRQEQKRLDDKLQQRRLDDARWEQSHRRTV